MVVVRFAFRLDLGSKKDPKLLSKAMNILSFTIQDEASPKALMTCLASLMLQVLSRAIRAFSVLFAMSFELACRSSRAQVGQPKHQHSLIAQDLWRACLRIEKDIVAKLKTEKEATKLQLVKLVEVFVCIFSYRTPFVISHLCYYAFFSEPLKERRKLMLILGTYLCHIPFSQSTLLHWRGRLLFPCSVPSDLLGFA
jgi:hypothetical protein